VELAPSSGESLVRGTAAKKLPVEAGVESAAAASAGSCAEQEAAGGGAGADAGVDAGDVGASGAGEPSGGRGSGAPAGFVRGNLPFTGLPVWLVALLGLTVAGAGVWVRRARELGAA
jgi:hypothetical protein